MPAVLLFELGGQSALRPHHGFIGVLGILVEVFLAAFWYLKWYSSQHCCGRLVFPSPGGVGCLVRAVGRGLRTPVGCVPHPAVGPPGLNGAWCQGWGISGRRLRTLLAVRPPAGVCRAEGFGPCRVMPRPPGSGSRIGSRCQGGLSTGRGQAVQKALAPAESCSQPPGSGFP